MAAYDPKRPRPRADGEEPAPVEALLDPDPAEPVAVAEPAEVRYVVELEDPDPAPDDAAPVEPAADSAAGAVDEPAGAGTTSTPSATDRPDLRLAGSDVPVAEPPPEPTANRAVVVVGAVGAGLLTLLVLLLLLRRRRR